MTGPILVFDSGVGGLSVLAPIRARLPKAAFVYVADNAGFPYGTRTEAEITARVPALLGRLTERHQPQLIVIACNTASTIALAHVRAALDVPVVGTVPAIKPAAAMTRSKVIGVLGTPTTVRQAYVDNLAAEFAADCTVLRYGAADLAALAESKLRGESMPDTGFHDAMGGLLEQAGGDVMDIVVLACTHFPLVTDELAAAAGRPLQFVDGAAGIAKRTAYLLRDADWAGVDATGVAIFTRADENAERLRPALALHGLPNVEYL